MDIQQFKDRFIAEAHDLTENLERDLLALENDPTDQELIEQVFRVMHTLKGVSGMYGFDKISEITHNLEHIYDLVRDGKMAVTTPILDLTLVTGDHIRQLLQDELLEKPENIEQHQKLLTAIELQLSGNATAPAANHILRKKKEKTSKVATYNILFYPSEELIFRCINILGTLRDLLALGEYRIEKTETPATNDSWSIFLVTEKPQSEIDEAIMFTSDNFKVRKIADINIFNTNELDQREKELEIAEEPPQLIEDEVNTSIEKHHDNTLVNDSVQNAPELSRIAVDISKLDRLMFLVSELITANSQLTLSTKEKTYKPIQKYVEKIDNLSKQFRANAFDIRLVPIGDMVMRFKRLVRDLSKQLNKEVEFITQGTDIELDKNTVDKLSEPLIHIIRNCIDHGIENAETRLERGKNPVGKLKITSYSSGNYVYIEIQDDGNGLNGEKLRNKAIEKGLISPDKPMTDKEIYELIFLPGISTANSLSEISGRGVGMNIVKKRIEDMRGEVDITSKNEIGTTFTIKLQQSVAILDTMLIKVENQYCLIPLEDIETCSQITGSELNERSFSHTLKFNNNLIPFIDLRELFQLQTTYPPKLRMLVLKRNDRHFAVIADSIVGEHQAVVKPLGKMFSGHRYAAGMSILGEGSLAMILDTNHLQQIAIQTKTPEYGNTTI